MIYSQTTRNITVTVMPDYLEDQSIPEDAHYVWSYTIQIENQGAKTVQLINRYWHITDGNGVVQEVRGPGVVGEQPVLAPGEVFQYTSGAALKTASGLMVGNYELMTDEGDRFLIDIPSFSLDSTEQVVRPN